MNDAPIVVDDNYQVSEDGVLNIPSPGILANDIDLEDDSLFVTLVSVPANGTVELNDDGSFTYAAFANYFGTDSFTYTAFDTGGAQSEEGIVNLTVTPVNDPPDFLYPPVESAVVGDEYQFIAATVELDGDEIQFSANGLPDFLSVSVINAGEPGDSFDPDTISYLISGIPTSEEDAGTYEISLFFDEYDNEGNFIGYAQLDYILIVKLRYEYTLKEGWDWRSFPVASEGEDGLTFFDSVLDSLTAVLAYPDDALYETPDGWNNAIESIDRHLGYMVKMENSEQLITEGFKLSESDPMNLNNTWNWIGYYGSEGLTAFDAFSSILDELVIVESRTGALVEIPDGSGGSVWLDGIGELEYTEGYIAKLTSAVEGFTWTQGSSSPQQDGGDYITISTTRSLTSPEYFKFTETMEYELITIKVVGEGLEGGAEIAAFSGGVCVGAVVYSPDGNGYFQLVAWEDDPYTTEVDGFVDGEQITLKLWTSQTELELTNIEWIEFNEWNTTGHFASNSISGTVLELDALGLEIFGLPEEMALHANFPNPFNPTTTIRFDLTADSHVSLAVYDILGREVKMLINRTITGGYHQIVWNGRDNSYNAVPSGVYMYRFIVDGKVINTKKMMIIK